MRKLWRLDPQATKPMHSAARPADTAVDQRRLSRPLMGDNIVAGKESPRSGL
jgi:hypothetical protein